MRLASGQPLVLADPVRQPVPVAHVQPQAQHVQAVPVRQLAHQDHVQRQA